VPLPTSTAEMFESQGFKVDGVPYTWTMQDDQLLKGNFVIFFFTKADTLKKIGNKNIEITTKNPFYWIAHYIFDDKDGITEKVIKEQISILANEMDDI
jgi:hypothetical protein